MKTKDLLKDLEDFLGSVFVGDKLKPVPVRVRNTR